jgi:hypothetical protein
MCKKLFSVFADETFPISQYWSPGKSGDKHAPLPLLLSLRPLLQPTAPNSMALLKPELPLGFVSAGAIASLHLIRCCNICSSSHRCGSQTLLSRSRLGLTASAIMCPITPITKGTPCPRAIAIIERPVTGRSGYVSIPAAVPKSEAVAALVVDATIPVVA